MFKHTVLPRMNDKALNTMPSPMHVKFFIDFAPGNLTQVASGIHRDVPFEIIRHIKLA